MNLAVAKKELRKTLLGRRAAMSEESRSSWSMAAAARIMAFPLWREAHSVALYVDLGSEISTAGLLGGAWQAGKTVLLPKITDPHARAMIFAPSYGFEDLERGLFGILQPTLPPSGIEPDLLIMPGVAFDRHGNRLGMGGGYYDIYLKNHWRDCVRMGFCFAFQLLEQLPHEERDQKVDYICHNLGLLKV